MFFLIKITKNFKFKNWYYNHLFLSEKSKMQTFYNNKGDPSSMIMRNPYESLSGS
jgi:hypothetical protein